VLAVEGAAVPVDALLTIKNNAIADLANE